MMALTADSVRVVLLALALNGSDRAAEPVAIAARAATQATPHAVIPPFSRKYRTSCSTCHVTPGKLNGQGEAFRQNGYRFPDDDAGLREEQPVPLGAEPWKDLWPDAIWPGEIPGALPLSLHIINDVRVGRSADGNGRARYIFPAGVVLQSGTSLGEGIAAFAELAWRPGTGLQIGEVRAMLQDPLPFLPARALNLWVGTLRPHLLAFGDISLDRATRLPFLWQWLRLADWPLPREGQEPLTAESSFRLGAIRPSIELNGLAAGRLHYGLGLTQTPSTSGDDATPTDLYYKVRLKRGGLAFDGRGAADAAAWGGQLLERGTTLEHFAYFGQSTLPDGAVDSHRSFGLAGRMAAGRADLGIGHVWGRHSNPWGVAGLRARHSSVYARGEYLLYPWLLGSLRGDRTRFRASGPGDADAGTFERARVLPGLVMLVRHNVRVVAEGELYVRDQPRFGPAGERDALWLRLDLAF
jgi:hypothetical protein